MYRAVTWLAMQRGVDLGDGEALGGVALAEPVRFDEQERVWIAGTDVTSSIRSDRVDRMVPVVARHPAVREVMRDRQRELGAEGDVGVGAGASATALGRAAAGRSILVADPACGGGGGRARRRGTG